MLEIYMISKTVCNKPLTFCRHISGVLLHAHVQTDCGISDTQEGEDGQTGPQEERRQRCQRHRQRHFQRSSSRHCPSQQGQEGSLVSDMDLQHSKFRLQPRKINDDGGENSCSNHRYANWTTKFYFIVISLHEKYNI